MKKLNREKVIRMVGGEINNRIGISSSGGSGGGGLAGAATQAWVDANYVSIEFFDRLFQAYSGTGSSATRVNANDTESTIDNIKAMFGFWTEQYLSTLGQGSGGGGGGAEALSDLLDVELTTLQNGQALIYSSALGKWTNGTAGVNMTQVWSALGSATNEQINISHLTGALTPYAETSYVDTQINNTKTWVGQNFITIAFFDRLFQAYNGTGSSATRVNPNDTTSTIDNIKAMFGFWTEFYLSALGDGSASSGSISLGMLSDVSLSSPTDGQALIYDATLGIWKNGTITSGVSSLSALSDVQLTAPATNQVLMYDSSTTKWYNSDLKTINGNSIIGAGDISISGIIGSTKILNNYYDSRPASANIKLGNGTVVQFKATSSMTTAKPPGDGTILHFAWDNTGGYESQLFIANNPDNLLQPRKFLAVRGQNANTWSDWIDVITQRGGTMTGDIKFTNKGFSIYQETSHGTKVFNLGSGTGSTTVGYELGIFQLFHNSVECTRFYANNGGYANWVCNGSNAGNFGVGTDRPQYKLDVRGNISVGSPGSSGTIGCIYSSNNSGFYNYIQFNSGDGGLQYYGGTWSDNSGALAHKFWVNSGMSIAIINNGYVGFGTSSPSYRVHVIGDIYATGGVTALSDIRHKTIIRDTDIDVDQIARMPAVMYQWSDGRDDNGLHVGSIAQDWQRVLPEVVMRANDKEGTLSMQYGVAALVSSIITARKVVDHERRIAELEKENKELKLKLKIA